jgi:hypothetical protein
MQRVECFREEGDAWKDIRGGLVKTWFNTHSGVDLVNVLLKSGPRWFTVDEFYLLLQQEGYSSSERDKLDWLHAYTARSWWAVMAASGRYTEEQLNMMRQYLEKFVKEEVCNG